MQEIINQLRKEMEEYTQRYTRIYTSYENPAPEDIILAEHYEAYSQGLARAIFLMEEYVQGN
jgi:hypothetical protein